MKRTIKKAIGGTARFYHKIRASRGIWNALNSKSRKLYKEISNPISAEEQKVFEDLKNHGIAITHIDKLFPKETFLELKAYAEKRWNDPDVKARYEKRNDALEGDKLKNKSFFLVDLWEGDRIIDLSHPFTRLSLSKPVLNVVNAYMGMLTKFKDWRLQVTVPMPEGMRSFASQEWHRDPEDQQLVKVFLYISDVDENSGPFIYLKNSQFGGKWRKMFPQKPPSGSAGDESKIPQEDKLVCTGKSGSLIFCDTSGLHRGGHAKSNNRFMYTSVYTSHATVWPVAYKYPENFKKDGLDRAAKYAITNKVKAGPKFYSW